MLVALIPLLTAAVTLSGAWLKEAMQRRSREQTRQRLIAQTKEEISTIESWAKAHASLWSSEEPPESVRNRAQADLDTTYNRISRLTPEIRQPVRMQEVLSRLLLRHVQVKGLSRALRYLYYILLFMLFAWGAAAFSQPNSWSSVVFVLATLTTYFVVAIAPAWLLGFLTRYVAGRQAARPQQHSQGSADGPTPPYSGTHSRTSYPTNMTQR